MATSDTLSFALKALMVMALVCVLSAVLEPGGCSEPRRSQIQNIDDLIAAGKYNEAIKLARVQEKASGQSVLLKAAEATAYMFKGSNVEAKKEAEAALKLNPKNHEAHWVLANVYMSMGQSARGMEEYQLSIKYPSKKRCKPCEKKSAELLERFKH